MKNINWSPKSALQNYEFYSNLIGSKYNYDKGPIHIWAIPCAYNNGKKTTDKPNERIIAFVLTSDDYNLNQCPDGHIYEDWKDRFEITKEQLETIVPNVQRRHAYLLP